jgi:hypothetical protein
MVAFITRSSSPRKNGLPSEVWSRSCTSAVDGTTADARTKASTSRSSNPRNATRSPARASSPGASWRRISVSR